MQMPSTPMPDKDGYFGEYGGQIIPPELKAVMDQITAAVRSRLEDRPDA